MKKVFFILALFALVSCGDKNEGESGGNTNNENRDKFPDPVPNENGKDEAESENDKHPAGIFGLFVGMFDADEYKPNKRPSYTNKISVFIDEIKGDLLKGHSVVAGNERPFEGSYSVDSDRYSVEAKEPGDDKYDGAFSFVIDPSNGKIKGNWIANDKNLAVTKRKFDLEKKEFKYNKDLDLPENVSWNQLYDNSGLGDEYEVELTTDDVIRFNASNTELKKEDVENMHKGDLEILRNSIYARHGYSFKNRKMRYVFDQSVDWYIPYSTDVRDELTSLEQKNIELIKRYEEHADRYYDYFGR